MGVRNAALTRVCARHTEAPFSSSGPEPHLAILKKKKVFCLFVVCWLLISTSTPSAFSMHCYRVLLLPTWRWWGGTVWLAPRDAIENVEKSSHCSLWSGGLPSRRQTPGLEPSRLPSGFCVCAAFSSCPSV